MLDFAGCERSEYLFTNRLIFAFMYSILCIIVLWVSFKLPPIDIEY